MGVGDICAVVCASCCFLFAPFILQTVGFFTPMWGSNTTCNSIGLLYSCCVGSDNKSCENTNGGDELDVRALGLQATSFSVMFLAVVFSCFGACCKGDDADDVGKCATLGGLCFMLFPVAGLFSVIGCIIVATKFSTAELGYSFYLCLVAGLFIIIFTIVVCICVCKILKNDDDDDMPSRSASRVYPSAESVRTRQNAVEPYYGGEAAPYESRQQQIEYELHHESGEQAVAVHDEESGQLFFLIRKFNFTKIVANIKN